MVGDTVVQVLVDVKVIVVAREIVGVFMTVRVTGALAKNYRDAQELLSNFGVSVQLPMQKI
jgi:hypothetical protein